MSQDPTKTVTETLWKVLDANNEWIRFADTKAAALMGGEGILLGILVGKVADSRAFLLAHSIVLILAALSLAALVASLLYCLFCISPSLGFLRPKPHHFVPHPTHVHDEPASLIFFGHIAERESEENYRQQAAETFDDEDALLAQVAQQVYANARIARDKSKQVAWAVQLLAVAGLFGLIAGIAAFFGA